MIRYIVLLLYIAVPTLPFLVTVTVTVPVPPPLPWDEATGGHSARDASRHGHLTEMVVLDR